MEFNINDAVVHLASGNKCQIVAEVQDCYVVKTDGVEGLTISQKSYFTSQELYDQMGEINEMMQSVKTMIEMRSRLYGFFDMSLNDAKEIHSAIEKACGRKE